MRTRNTYQTNDEPKKRLSVDKAKLQKQKASCYMVVKFHDKNVWSKWSDEYQSKKLENISDAVNLMFRIIESFKGRVASAAIFDTRVDKSYGAHNKIYQYENRVWKMVQPFTW